MSESETHNRKSENSQEGQEDEMSLDLAQAVDDANHTDSDYPQDSSRICMSQHDILAMTGPSDRRLSELTIQSTVEESSVHVEEVDQATRGSRRRPSKGLSRPSHSSKMARAASSTVTREIQQPGAVAVSGIDEAEVSGYASIDVPMAPRSSQLNMSDDDISSNKGPFGSSIITPKDENSSQPFTRSIVKAQTVSNEELEEEILTRYMQRATPAKLVRVVSEVSITDSAVHANKDNNLHKCFHKPSKACMLISILSSVCLLIGCGVIVGIVLFVRDGTNPIRNQRDDPFVSGIPTLDIIQDRGYVKCRGDPDELKQGYGFSIDMCSAIAAAIFRDPTKYEMLRIPFKDMFTSIANGIVDLSTSHTTTLVSRDIYEPTSRQGFTFSDTYFYTGTVFFGTPAFVDCADRRDTLSGVCRELAVCVLEGSIYDEFLKNHIDGSARYPVKFNEEAFVRLSNGRCNVVAGSTLMVYEMLAKEQISQDQLESVGYVFSPRSYERDPLGLTTRNDDPEFSDFVNWLLRALIKAEAWNMTQDTASEFPVSNRFGEQYRHMFQDAVAAVGNYGEMYHRSWKIIDRPKGSINTFHQLESDGGLLYPYPVGLLDIDNDFYDPQPSLNGTLEAVTERGALHCGVIVGRPGLADWNDTLGDWAGIDADLCRGLSAAVHMGDTSADSIFIAEFETLQEGFVALHNGEIDVLAGATYNMENDVREPTTGQGFAFGHIYYYQKEHYGNETGQHGRPLQEDGVITPLAMATREDDPQWSDFVRSIIHSTIYAEDFGIDQVNAVEMPLLELFGQSYLQAFRHIIWSIGNYEQIYKRNMEFYIPRSNNTRNTLNKGDTPLLFANWEF